MKTEANRFWEKVSKTDLCWFWTASVRKGNYGQFWSRNAGRLVQAHRWAYEELVGPIPEGLFLDHLCRNPRCVNPEHLEPVTNRENLVRGDNPMSRNAKKTHCDNGHPLSGDNLAIRGGSRACRTCGNANTRESHRRRMERDPDYEKRRYHAKEAAAGKTCVDCGASVGSRATRCRSCNNKLMWAKRRGEQLEEAWRNAS